MTIRFKEGTRVRHRRNRELIGTIIRVYSTNLARVRLCWDGRASDIEWYSKDDLEVINQRMGYYLASVVVKVDLNEEHWETQANIDFGMQTMLCKQGYDALHHKDSMGVTLVGYKLITPEEFNQFKCTLFNSPGDF